MEKHKLIIKLTEPLNVKEFNHLCEFLGGAEGIQNKYSTINEESVPAETLVMLKIADIIKEVINLEIEKYDNIKMGNYLAKDKEAAIITLNKKEAMLEFKIKFLETVSNFSA